MKAAIKVGLLTSRHHPQLPYFLEELQRDSGIETFLIFDAKNFSVKDRAIFSERTGHAFPTRDIEAFTKLWPTVTVSDHNAQDCQDYVRTNGIPLLVNAGTPRILRAALLKTPSIGVLNAHPGILPKYRGASCCEWAIYNNDPVGVTAHFMDEGVDSGPILFSERYPVRAGESYQDIRIGLYRLAHRVRLKAIHEVFEKGLTPQTLHSQPDAAIFKPIPPELFEEVKQKGLKRASMPRWGEQL